MGFKTNCDKLACFMGLTWFHHIIYEKNTLAIQEVIPLFRFEHARLWSLHHWKHDNFEVNMVQTTLRVRIANA